MNRIGLILGIDLSNEYCQVCYYNTRHKKAESIRTGSSVNRYLIPAVMAYDNEKAEWMIGEEAMLYCEQTGSWLIKGMLNALCDDLACSIGGEKYTYEELFSIFFEKIIDMARVNAGISSVESVTVTTRSPGRELKEKFEKIFECSGICAEHIKVMCYAESFAYYVLNEDESLWRDGALLFDFDTDGFFVKQLTFTENDGNILVYVNEKRYIGDFNVKDLASQTRRNEMDRRLSDIYINYRSDGRRCSVYFTGTGFSELWFNDTLSLISEDCRAFKGNNLYVKGACISGYSHDKRTKDYPIICKGRTKATISVAARCGAFTEETALSRAATDWYDAGYKGDFILTGKPEATFIITSLITRARTEIVFDLSEFPQREEKATRVEIKIEYKNQDECEISVSDKGFGEIHESSGLCVSKKFNLEEYI